MSYSIRHKATGDIIVMRSGNKMWAKPAHAKAAWMTSGLDYQDRQKYGYTPTGSRFGFGKEGWKFDAQDDFEIIEVETCPREKKALARAVELLEKAEYQLHDSAYVLLDEIEDFLKAHKNAA